MDTTSTIYTVSIPMGGMLANIHKSNGHNQLLKDWTERVRMTALMYQVPESHYADLALSSLEKETHRVILVFSPEQQSTIEVIIQRLEILNGDTAIASDLYRKFYTQVQREEEAIQQFMIGL